MTAVIIIIIIAVILYYLFWNKKTDEKAIAINEENKDNEIEIKEFYEEEIYTDENGRYRLLEKTREIPRRTYIKAVLNGKYWGEIDEQFSNQFAHSKFFDFNIYEVTLNNAEYSKFPFEINEDYNIPREKLPKLLHTILQKDGKAYEVNLHEPIFELGSIKFNRKLHQDEGNEVFGTIDAIVAGYILDFIVEHYTEKEYLIPINEIVTVPKIEEPVLTKTNTPTGNVEHNGNYKRTEYFYSDYKKTYWSDWKYTKPPTTTNNEGCFSSVIGLLAGIIGIAFLLMLLPQMAILLPFFLILFLLNLIPARFFSWLFRIIGILLLLGFVASLFHFFNTTTTQTYIPKPVVTEQPEERKTHTEPIIDPLDNKTVNDTIIKHFRVWQDYDGNQYEGTIWTKKSDFTKAKYFKNNLTLNSNSSRAYDEMIYRLKENDKNNLNGVYQLFDSIRQKEQLSSVKFAELIVSFVQDIPYTVIVPDDCNPNLYDDEFIKEYLSSADSRCDGFEKFGINSPVEFMSTLNGDCDTRTLLLYTVLAHYGYDVALFSSEYYAHSIIGINLPISGMTYQYQNQRYVLWETTAPNIKAGVLPKEISNLNYWRISLKSK
ncbi:hypothetical protein [Bergeyella sp. RCAD1439]|uniref:hypothetical protein n=1 Tax=Bergeyella anatis TaxID=3113737 RepID=UPI002E19AD28|nr:hypothetical protein [Bergeyella sp. RCAD1439]